MVHQNRNNFRFWLPVQIWNDLWPIILCNLKTKHRRYIKLYIFWILMTRQTIWHYLQRNRNMFQFLTHVELSRSMAAILEMPQYVAYQKNVVYAFIKLSAKSHSFNILCTMDGLSCTTINPSTQNRTGNCSLYIHNWYVTTCHIHYISKRYDRDSFYYHWLST